MKTPGVPDQVLEDALDGRARGAPLAGEHTRDVLREAGYPRRPDRCARRGGSNRRVPGCAVIRYRGLTWDHPRGAHALAAAARRLDPARDGIAIDWDRQPLEGFESHPIADLCARYDLVVLDHPHVGEAVATGCLRPLEELFLAEEIADWSARTIGPCLTSYRYAGAHWALPLDAATQVMAVAPRVAAHRATHMV